MTPEQKDKRIAELEEGLRPFAKLKDLFDRMGWQGKAVVYGSGEVFVRVDDFRRAASLLAAPASEPDAGFVVVPAEPTEAMIWAGESGPDVASHDGDAAEIYHAMLAAKDAT